MKEIIFILLCLPLYVVNSFCDKHVSASHGKSGYLYNVAKFLVGSAVLLPVMLLDSGAKFKAGVLLCGVLCGVMYAVSKSIILRGYRETSVAFMTFCHAAGMILPCVIGHFLWEERLSVFAVIGILLAVSSAVLLKGDCSEKTRFSAKGICIGVLVFFASGGVMLMQKLMGKYFADQSVGAYNLYSFFIAFVILGFFVKPQKGIGKEVKTVLPFAVASALSLCIISLVMTALAGKVPSVILFPLFNGLGIILVSVGSVFAFREKMTLQKGIGLIVGILGLSLVNIP